MKSFGINNTEQIYSDSLKVCNDCLKSDVSLLYPPHMIAIGKSLSCSLYHIEM